MSRFQRLRSVRRCPWPKSNRTATVCAARRRIVPATFDHEQDTEGYGGMICGQCGRRVRCVICNAFSRSICFPQTPRFQRSKLGACNFPGSRWQLRLSIWEFPKIRGTLFWGPYNKGSYNLGCYIGVPYFRNPILSKKS